MTESPDKETLKTFKARAANYERESSWVRDIQLIDPLVPESFGSGIMLDVCCGTGVVAKNGLDKGWKVIASDISRAMLERCLVPGITRIISDTSTLPFRDKIFDLVTIRQGLQYFDPALALKELQRVSASQIRLAHITMEHPEDRKLWHQYFRIASPGRRCIFSPGQVAELCERIGLKVIDQTVIHTRDWLKGPISHVSEKEMALLDTLMRKAPRWFKNRYKVISVNDDYEYSHRWEFIITSV